MRARRAGGDRTVGAILGGGRSTRFGSPKGLAEIDGEAILTRVLAAHRKLFADVVLVTDEPAPYRAFRVDTIPDVYHGQGPVAGIHAALRWAYEAGAEGICCTPCDAPFVHADLLAALVRSGAGAEAVIPRSEGPLGFEPLFGWYSISILPELDAFLAGGHRAAHELVSRLRNVGYLSLEEVERVAPPDTLFLNVNTPDDLLMARRRIPGGNNS